MASTALPDNLCWKGNKIYYVVSHNGIVSKGTAGTNISDFAGQRTKPD
jgi:hypothetical protein